MIINADSLASIKRLNCELQDESKRLKAETEIALKSSTLISNILMYIEKGWPMHLLNLADKETKLLEELSLQRPAQMINIKKAYAKAKDDSSRLIRRYPSVFDEACKAARITLDANSRHPKYGIKNGFFRVEINESKHIAKISNLEGKLAELPADVDAVVERIRIEYIRVFGRRFHGPNFLKKIRAQYNRIIQREHLRDGESVPIKEITRLLKKKEKEFRMDEFVADLSILAEKGPHDIDGRQIDLQQTKDIQQGVLLNGASSRGYIGFIIFKEKI